MRHPPGVNPCLRVPPVELPITACSRRQNTITTAATSTRPHFSARFIGSPHFIFVNSPSMSNCPIGPPRAIVPDHENSNQRRERVRRRLAQPSAAWQAGFAAMNRFVATRLNSPQPRDSKRKERFPLGIALKRMEHSVMPWPSKVRAVGCSIGLGGIFLSPGLSPVHAATRPPLKWSKPFINVSSIVPSAIVRDRLYCQADGLFAVLTVSTNGAVLGTIANDSGFCVDDDRTLYVRHGNRITALDQGNTVLWGYDLW